VLLARVYHGRYLVPGVDLDNPARVLLARAQGVRAQVTAAAVAAAGLLDAGAADVLLAEQEWDIACTLYQQARLRALHHHRTSGADQATRQVEAPQLAALEESVAAVTRRVEALEKYSRHIDAADAAYRDWRQSLDLAGRNEDHLELLARTVRDEQGIEEIEGLSEQARLVGRALHASLGDAAHVAGTLATGPAK
jgi:hypothetical protein